MHHKVFIPISIATILTACAIVVLSLRGNVGIDAEKTTPGHIIELIALSYGLIGASSSSLQIKKMLRTQSSRDVSPAFLFLLAGSFMTWLSYGIVLQNWVMWIVNSVGLSITTTAGLLALRMRRQDAVAAPETL